MFSDRGLHLYATAPNLQIGPLAFAAAEPLRYLGPSHGRYAAVILLTALGPLALWLLSRIELGGRAIGNERLLLAGLILLPVWCELATHFAHLDDVMALLLALAALVAVARRRALLAALLLAAAAGSKPWAVAFVAVLLALPAASRLRAGVVWLGALAIVWCPFLLADSKTLRAAHFRIPTAASSSLRVFGVNDALTPSWDRPTQVALGLAAAVLAVRAGRWPAVLLAAVAARLLLDPATKSYYVAGLVVAALVVDLWLRDSPVPLFAVSGVVLLLAVRGTGLGPHLLGWLRALYCVGVLMWCAWPSRSGFPSGGAPRARAAPRG